MEEYKIERLLEELDKGFQIHFTYVKNKYLIFKTAENCYTLKLTVIPEKNPHPTFSIITQRRLVEMHPNMEEMEYKVG